MNLNNDIAASSRRQRARPAVRAAPPASSRPFPQPDPSTIAFIGHPPCVEFLPAGFKILDDNESLFRVLVSKDGIELNPSHIGFGNIRLVTEGAFVCRGFRSCLRVWQRMMPKSEEAPAIGSWAHRTWGRTRDPLQWLWKLPAWLVVLNRATENRVARSWHAGDGPGSRNVGCARSLSGARATGSGAGTRRAIGSATSVRCCERSRANGK